MISLADGFAFFFCLFLGLFAAVFWHILAARSWSAPWNKQGAMSALQALSLILVAFIIAINSPGPVDGSDKKTELSVGYLTAIKGDLKDRQGLAISGAITMALEEINNDPNILPNVTLVLKWNDTRGDQVISTRAITEMICDGVATIFGPEGSCHVEAIVTQSRNIPMFAYVSGRWLMFMKW